MISAKLVLATLTLFWVSAVSAQNPAVDKNDNREILRMGLYPPDILMRQQQRLEITKAQRADIAALVRDFQVEVTELQWSMPAEQQKLRDIVNQSDIDAEAALAQVETVLKMESEFKLDHFRLLIAIKKKLTSEQIETLDRAIRRRVLRDD